MSAEPPSSSGLPGRSRPALSDLSKETGEDDLWNIDEEQPEAPRALPKPPPAKRETAHDSPSPEPTPPEPRRRHPMGESAESGPPVDEIGDLDDGPASEVVTLSPEPIEPPAAAEKPAVAAKPAASKRPAAAEEPLTESPPTATARPAPEETKAVPPKETRPKKATEGAKPARTRLNRREVLGLAAFACVLLAVAIWILTGFFSHLAFRSDFVDGPDFPLQGNHAALAAADSFWREPIREGETPDVARREVTMIPVLEISLDPEGSTAGALRVIFHNGEGDVVGDSITRSFSSGRFDASGEAMLAFPATDGFLDHGTFNAYRTGKGESWTAHILEGPSVNAPASSFKSLTRVPLLPLRR